MPIARTKIQPPRKQDELFATLAAHDHIEVRLFNPLPARSTSLGSRVVFSLHEFARIRRSSTAAHSTSTSPPRN